MEKKYVLPDCPDNHDMRLKYYETILECRSDGPIPVVPLPEGFHFTYYREGDKETWIEIETSAREFHTHEEGESAWKRYYGGRERELLERMLFVETEAGEKAATATAFYEPQDTSGAGWLHWVSVKREYQGRGLSRPLISKTLARLQELGYAVLKIPTQTNTWVAARIYLDFGFYPEPENAVRSRDGYRILRTLTNHPALQEFQPMPYEEIWDPKMLETEVWLRERFPDLIDFKIVRENGEGKIYCRRPSGTEELSVSAAEVDIG